MLPAPALLLADEPTGNLDSVTGALITGLLKEQAHAHGVSLVVVTHDLRVAGQADEVLELRDGRIEARNHA
jgi:putative ABC transport system ATP-binding protein